MSRLNPGNKNNFVEESTEIILSKNISEIQDCIASETNFMMRKDLDFETSLYQKKRIEDVHGSCREVKLILNLLSSAHVKRVINYNS